MESEIISHSKEQYGIDIATVLPIRTGVMNKNFMCSTHTGKRYIFKIYNHKNSNEVGFEVEVLELLAEKKFCPPQLITTTSGQKIVLFQNKPAVLYLYIEGENPKVVSEGLIEKIGRTMGQLHAYTAGFVPSIKKPTWDPVDLARLVVERGHEITDRNVPRGQEILDFVNVHISQFTFPQLPSGITHQDIKPENIIVKNGDVVGLVDFDNSYYGAYIHDLTTTALWTCFPQGAFDEKLFDALVRGYETQRPLETVEKEVLMDALRWRLVREVFIGPFVTLDFPEVVSERSLNFMNLYKSLGK